MKHKKVKVVITMGSGVEMKIESDRETIREIVTDLHRKEEQRIRFREDFMKRREYFLKHTKNVQEHGNVSKDGSSKKTKKDIVLDLLKNGFFNEPKLIGDVQKAMAERGYHYPSTSLSPLLIRLLQQGILVRAREEKGWKYIRKR